MFCEQAAQISVKKIKLIDLRLIVIHGFHIDGYKFRHLQQLIHACATHLILVGSVTGLRTGGHWFDPRLGQYSFRGLMIVIATGSCLSQRCPLFRQWLCGKAAGGIERILCGVLVNKEF